jgi:hypothetical protein
MNGVLDDLHSSAPLRHGTPSKALSKVEPMMAVAEQMVDH